MKLNYLVGSAARANSVLADDSTYRGEIVEIDSVILMMYILFNIYSIFFYLFSFYAPTAPSGVL